MKTKGKPPRLRPIRWLREIFLMTQPPLLAVMQGGDYRARFQFIHIFYDHRYSKTLVPIHLLQATNVVTPLGGYLSAREASDTLLAHGVSCGFSNQHANSPE